MRRGRPREGKWRERNTREPRRGVRRPPNPSGKRSPGSTRVVRPEKRSWGGWCRITTFGGSKAAASHTAYSRARLGLGRPNENDRLASRSFLLSGADRRADLGQVPIADSAAMPIGRPISTACCTTPGAGHMSHMSRPEAHRLDELSAGYSLAGCSPAAPASAFPAVSEFGNRVARKSTIFQPTVSVPLCRCLSLGARGKSVLWRKKGTASRFSLVEPLCFQHRWTVKIRGCPLFSPALDNVDRGFSTP